ncbi:hypothetical protein MJO28_002371 [Puccinia striiformis f. sp. tritici]|uniref:Uncharacterized protein n=1 Tax=Puccinia striiformis f. sp. tritici TaxID=168172 RepID=A0ACC0EWN1_9BASI|nr:hypothetical protein MJO28_002371 [Puccinia striiformis f. sp. tritici]
MSNQISKGNKINLCLEDLEELEDLEQTSQSHEEHDHWPCPTVSPPWRFHQTHQPVLLSRWHIFTEHSWCSGGGDLL